MDASAGYAQGGDAAVVAAAQQWLADGHIVHLVTVVRTWGSSPRPPGSLLARRGDGVVVGSVSGGCVEAELPAWLPEPGEPPVTLHWGGAEAERLGLPCGGTLELFAEARGPGDAGEIAAVAGALERGETLCRRVERTTGAVTLEADAAGPDLVADEIGVAKRFGPAWRLLTIGAGELGSHLAAMARRLGYGVTVCDPRQHYRTAFDEPGVALTAAMPDEAVLTLDPGPRDAVVTTSHDPRLDDLALWRALESSAFYVGALGSRRTNDARRQRLVEFGLPEAAVERLRGPVGLAIGSRTPAEIAVAILAEMTAERRGAAVAHPGP
ncbi:MAG: XdhC family protein [Pseudomonadota bacterium]